MVKTQEGVVQENPISRLVCPIASVSLYGMPPIRRLQSDLVRAAGLKLDLEERVLVGAGKSLPLETSAFALGVIRRDEGGLTPRLGDVVRPGADALKASLHHRKVLFRNRPLAKLSAQLPGGVRRSGQHHEAGGRTVEAVDEAQERIRRRGLVSQTLFCQRQHVRVARMVGLRQKASRLSDDKEVVVEVKDFHGRGPFGVGRKPQRPGGKGPGFRGS
jgi:hypothetical protein